MALLDDIRRVEALALESGALLTLQSEAVAEDEQGLRYEISWASTQSAKDVAAIMAKSSGQAGFNPFLPHEEALFVCTLGDSHKLLLNKFQMAHGHVLAVTRDFQEQQSLLSRDDAAALVHLFTAADGLVMFNGGRDAGGSQDHRHLHFLPGGKSPLGAMFGLAVAPGECGRFDPFTFRHALTGLPPGWQDAADAVDRVREWLAEAYAACGIRQDGEKANIAYDIVMTRRWMLMVPRSRGVFMIGDIAVPVNALHYAGRIGVRRKEHMPVVRDVGMLAILAGCSAG
jgi:ATP adenylyltransferase